MWGFLSLHIAALLIWVAAVLYLTVLTTSIGHRVRTFADSPPRLDSIARFLYTHVASPAALISIGAGTAVFWIDRTLEFWLVLKLTLVVVLVSLHAFAGLLVLRIERQQFAGLRRMGTVLTTLLCVVLALILWIVLTKPGVPGEWPWSL